MNRYFLFAYVLYYPSGGMGDYKGAYATVEEARAAWEAADEETCGEIATVTDAGLVVVERLAWYERGKEAEDA